MTEPVRLSDVMRANVIVHTRMVDDYGNEPHFRPENQRKVRAMLESLRSRVGGGRLLDLGCGTGFIINLARDLFKEIDGVDVTPAMLAKVDTSSGNVRLHNQPAERLPFADGHFDLVTCYAFIHHVEDYSAILKEAFRVLRPGGLLYVDLEPNRTFWRSMTQLEERKANSGAEFSDIVEKEIVAVLHNDSEVHGQFGIDAETFNKAEFTKSILGGIDADEFVKRCALTGFSSCTPTFQWFLGQGAVMHGQSFEAAELIESYLQRIVPLSTGLFKYLRFVAVK